MTEERVGIFGGTFDPVHLGHMVLAENALDQAGLDRVIFIPSARPPHKVGEGITDERVRLKMVQAAIRGNESFFASDMEIRRRGPSYTFLTVQEIKEDHPDWDLYFLLGEDSLLNIHKWYRYEELMKSISFIVMKRSLNNREMKLRMDFYLDKGYHLIDIDSPLIDISASDIRDRIREKRSIRYMVPEGVRELIYDLNLYR